MSTAATVGDSFDPRCEVIEIHVAELKQLFNAIDPSPFHKKDLDAKAEDFIVRWAEDVAKDAPLALLVYLDRAAGVPDEASVLRDAIHQFFSYRADSIRRDLRQRLRVGRTSLVIGLGCLAASVAMGDFVATAFAESGLGDILRESFLIGGWVAMWRPMEVFLYDWWPIRADIRLYTRLSVIPVRIAYTGDASSEAWKWDWPALTATRVRDASGAGQS